MAFDRVSQLSAKLARMERAVRNLNGGMDSQTLARMSSIAGYADAAGIGGGASKGLRALQSSNPIMEGINSFREGAQERAGQLKAGLTSQSALGGLASINRATSLPDNGMPGFGMMSSLSKGPAVILESIEKLRAWNNELHHSNMQFADFSASMAQVQYQQEARDFQLKREQGERRAGSARQLAEAKSELDRRLAPIEDKWAEFQNKFVAANNIILNKVLGAVGIGNAGIPEEHVPGENEITSPHKFLADLGWEDERLKADRPKRLR